MRPTIFLPLALATAALAVQSAPVAAQQVRITEPRNIVRLRADGANANRAAIGVTTSTGSARDTLGVLVSAVTANGPAEKAGIGEGDRIASINGVSLKLAPADIGDQDMSNALSRRLIRELEKVKPGDEVELRVYTGGQTKTLKVKTVSSDELYSINIREPLRALTAVRKVSEDRAALGVMLGGTAGSKRDTLGVLIIGLDDDGPAAKAGLEEGNRIAAINGVNLRVSHEDAGDEYMSNSRTMRLQREVENLKPGDEVTLQVYSDGHFKTVKFKAAKASELKSRSRSLIINGGPGGTFRLPEDIMRLDEEGKVRAALERVRTRIQAQTEHLMAIPRVTRPMGSAT